MEDAKNSYLPHPAKHPDFIGSVDANKSVIAGIKWHLWMIHPIQNAALIVIIGFHPFAFMRGGESVDDSPALAVNTGAIDQKIRKIVPDNQVFAVIFDLQPDIFVHYADPIANHIFPVAGCAAYWEDG